eukprot:PhF_6_TR21925/c0_g1_i1/m.31145
MGNNDSKNHDALVKAEAQRIVTVRKKSVGPDDETTDIATQERIRDEALLAALSAVPELTPILKSDLDPRWVSRNDRRRNDIEKMSLPQIHSAPLVDVLATLQTSMLRHCDQAAKRQEELVVKMKAAESDSAKARSSVVTAVAALRTFHTVTEECVHVTKAVDDVHALCFEVQNLMLKLE